MIILQLYLSLGALVKHIDVKFYFVEEDVAESLILVKHTPTTSMLTYPLTKSLPIYMFQEHVSRMILL